MLVQDVIGPCVPGGLSTRARLILARALIFVIGVFLLVFGLWYELENQDLLDYLWITGSIYFIGAFALLVLGIYWKRASRIGAYFALIAGGSSVIGLAPVANRIGLKPLAECLGQARLGAIIGLTATVLALGMLVLGSADLAGPAETSIAPGDPIMTGWLMFWTWVLILGVIVFAGLAIAMTVGGFRGVLAMFRSIEQQHGEETAAEQSPQDRDHEANEG